MSFRHLIFTIFLLAICICCKNAGKQETATSDSTAVVSDEKLTYDQLFKLETYLAEDKMAETDMQSIDSSCAIVIYPTEDQIAELKKTEGEENFETIADDSNFYQGTAIRLLDSLGIKTVTAQRNYLRLTGKQKWTLAIRKKNLPEWNLILFNTSKEPEIIPAINVTATKVMDYFDVKK